MHLHLLIHALAPITGMFCLPELNDWCESDDIHLIWRRSIHVGIYEIMHMHICTHMVSWSLCEPKSQHTYLTLHSSQEATQHSRKSYVARAFARYLARLASLIGSSERQRNTPSFLGVASAWASVEHWNFACQMLLEAMLFRNVAIGSSSIASILCCVTRTRRWLAGFIRLAKECSGVIGIYRNENRSWLVENCVKCICNLCTWFVLVLKTYPDWLVEV